jgi:hypothetical protein
MDTGWNARRVHALRVLHPRGGATDEAERTRERIARRVARIMNSYVVPDVPPFTWRELVTLIIGAIVVVGILSLLILGAGVQVPAR